MVHDSQRAPGAIVQDLVPVVSPDPLLQLQLELVETLPERRKLACIEPGGGKLALDATANVSIPANPAAGSREPQAGTARICIDA